MGRCKAKKQSGDPCGAWAIKGATVCHAHGGSAPQVRRKARERLLEGADPAAALLNEQVKDKKLSAADRRSAAVAILDRAGLAPRFSANIEQQLDVNFNANVKFDYSRLTVDELEVLAKLIEQASIRTGEDQGGDSPEIVEGVHSSSVEGDPPIH
jgi:hypothetical protein